MFDSAESSSKTNFENATLSLRSNEKKSRNPFYPV